MATTATTTPNQPVTYSLLVIFTVDPSTDEHPRDQQSIRDEAESWLARPRRDGARREHSQSRLADADGRVTRPVMSC